MGKSKGKSLTKIATKADQKKRKRRRHKSPEVADVNGSSDTFDNKSSSKKSNEFSVGDEKRREKIITSVLDDAAVSKPNSFFELVDERLQTQPPFLREKWQSSDHRRLDLSGLKTVLLRHLAAVADDDFVKPERYILRKLRYKNAGPFSHHKFWQAARSISSYLDKFLAQKPSNALRSFAAGIEIQSDDSLYCPSIDYFTFSLCKLVRGAELLAKMMHLCSLCAKQSVGQLKYGHLVGVNLVLLSTAATVFRCAGAILTSICTVYDSSMKWHRSLSISLEPDNRMPLFPDQLAFLPAVSQALRLFAVRADNDQRKTHSDFVSDLLKMEGADLTLASNRREIEKAVASANPIVGVSGSSDMGLAVSRESEEMLNVLRTLRTHIEQWTSIGDVKKVRKQLKSAVDDRSVNLMRTIKRRWESLLVLHNMKQRDRLSVEIAQLRCELVVIIDAK